jgi:hypothetical protein
MHPTWKGCLLGFMEAGEIRRQECVQWQPGIVPWLWSVLRCRGRIMDRRFRVGWVEMAMPEDFRNRDFNRPTTGPAYDGSGERPTDDVLVEDHANVKEVEEKFEAANVYSDTVVFAAG